MTLEKLKNKYEEVEQETLYLIVTEINKNGTESKHGNFKSIPVNVFDYNEIAVIDSRLTFLDHRGYQYSLWAECTIEDLFEIIENF